MSDERKLEVKSEEAAPVTKKVCANLGCGVRIIPSTDTEEWLNVDGFFDADELSFELKPDQKFIKNDIRDLKDIPSGSVDYILCDQVLEHLPMADVPIALHEIRRILKVGGRAVLTVPDFKGALEAWLKINHDQHFNPFFYQYLSEVIYGLQTHEGEYHRTPFCPGFMNYSLQTCGLRKYRLVLHPAFSDSPDYPGIENPSGSKCRHAVLVADIIKEN